jgi:hypothetical protein
LEFARSTGPQRARPDEIDWHVDLSRRVSPGGWQVLLPQAGFRTDSAFRATIAGLGRRHSHPVVFVVWAFRVDDRNRSLGQVLVGLVLALVDGVGWALVALSVGPRWVAQPVTVGRTPSVGPEITFSDVGVSLGSATPGQTPADRAAMIRACGQRVGQPSRWLAAVPATPNGGDHDFAFVVQRILGLFVPVVVWIPPLPRCRTLPQLDGEPPPSVMLAGRL